MFEGNVHASGHLVHAKAPRCLLMILFLFLATTVPAQKDNSQRAGVQIVLLSDPHLDPFQDPAKVRELSVSPIGQWQRILSSAPSPDQSARFAAVQSACKGKEGADSSFALLRGALNEARRVSANAAYVIISGDLLVHELDCRYRFTMGLPPATTDDQSASAAFAEKTAAFVMEQILSTFPRIPVYFALGNNDSRCNHNRFDLHDAFFQTTAPDVLSGLRGSSIRTKAAAHATYLSAGYYALTMPGAMHRTRLIVLNDVFLMPAYTTCEGNADNQGAREQMKWLRGELDHARQHKQSVWVLSHLPTSIVPPSDASRSAAFCSSPNVVSYQSSPALANLLTEYADVVKLSIAGHTHTDEFRLLKSGTKGVPVKVVSSITPVDGNTPSFTVGHVNPASAKLLDFDVYKSADSRDTTIWTREYSFDTAYGVSDFSASSLRTLIGQLSAETPASRRLNETLREHMLKGSTTKRLPPSWKSYLCALDTIDPDVYARCTCTTTPSASAER